MAVIQKTRSSSEQGFTSELPLKRSAAGPGSPWGRLSDFLPIARQTDLLAQRLVHQEAGAGRTGLSTVCARASLCTLPTSCARAPARGARPPHCRSALYPPAWPSASQPVTLPSGLDVPLRLVSPCRGSRLRSPVLSLSLLALRLPGFPCLPPPASPRRESPCRTARCVGKGHGLRGRPAVSKEHEARPARCRS